MRLLLGCTSGQYDDGTSIADVLVWNTYGTETIPPRPVQRMAAENVMNNNKSYVQAQLKNIVLYMAKGRKTDAETTEKNLLTQLGRMMTAEARRIIASADQLQANAPATVKKKGFNHPLYVDGTLAKHLAYSVDAEDVK